MPPKRVQPEITGDLSEYASVEFWQRPAYLLLVSVDQRRIYVPVACLERVHNRALNLARGAKPGA